MKLSERMHTYTGLNSGVVHDYATEVQEVGEPSGAKLAVVRIDAWSKSAAHYCICCQRKTTLDSGKCTRCGFTHIPRAKVRNVGHADPDRKARPLECRICYDLPHRRGAGATTTCCGCGKPYEAEKA